MEWHRQRLVAQHLPDKWQYHEFGTNLGECQSRRLSRWHLYSHRDDYRGPRREHLSSRNPDCDARLRPQFNVFEYPQFDVDEYAQFNADTDNDQFIDDPHDDQHQHDSVA